MERVSASIVECVLLWSASSCIRASCVVSWLTRCCLAGGRSRAARPSRQTDIQSTAMEMDTTPANGSSRARRPRHTAMRAPPSTNSPATEHAATATAMEDVVATPVIAVAALLSTPTIVSPTRSLISPHTLKSGGRQHSHVQKFSCDGCAAARKGGCNKRTSGCERCKENGIECTYVRDGSATSNGTKRSRGGEESSEEQKSSGSTQSTADSASPKRQRKSPRIARGGSPSLDATPASGTSTAASTEESKSQMDFFTPTPLSSSTVVSTRQSLANGGRSPVSSLLSTPASPSPHEPAAKLRQSPVVKQLILSPKLHGAAAAAATQNGDAAEIVRRTSSVADNALTPRLPTEDIEPTPAASSIESTPSGSTPSGSTPSGSTPAPSQSKAASSEDADGDVQMQSASTDSSDDESYDPEMESLSSLSTRSSPASTASAAPSLERTFSSAATPVQLSQEDEVELAAVASTPPPSSSSSKHSAFSPPSMASPKIEPFPPTPEDTVTVNLAAEVKLQPRMLAGGRPTRSGSTASKEKMVSPTLSPVKLRRADATAHAPTAVRTSPIRPAKNKAAAAAAASLAVPVHQPPTRSLASSSAASSSGTGASSQAMLGDVLTGAAIMEDPASTFRVEAAAATCCGFFRKVRARTWFAGRYVCVSLLIFLLPPLPSSR
jgi:hypothetical protein